MTPPTKITFVETHNQRCPGFYFRVEYNHYYSGGYFNETTTRAPSRWIDKGKGPGDAPRGMWEHESAYLVELQNGCY